MQAEGLLVSIPLGIIEYVHVCFMYIFPLGIIKYVHVYFMYISITLGIIEYVHVCFMYIFSLGNNLIRTRLFHVHFYFPWE